MLNIPSSLKVEIKIYKEMMMLSFYPNNKIALVFLLILLTSGCTSLSPTPYSDAFLSPIKLLNEGVTVTQTENFRPENIGRIVVSVDDVNIKQFEQGNVFYLLETDTMAHLLGKGYKVVTRTDDKARKKEMKTQSQQNTEGASVDNWADVAPAQLIINVTKVITIPVKGKTEETKNKLYYNNHVSISARLLNLQSSQLLWTASVNKTKWIKKGLEIDSIQAALNDVMAKFPAKKL